MIKSWNFVRTFLSSFLEKILKRASMEITKTLTSTLFFLSKPQQSIYHCKEDFIQIQLCKRIIPKKCIFLEVFRVNWHVLSWEYDHLKLEFVPQRCASEYFISRRFVKKFSENFLKILRKLLKNEWIRSLVELQARSLQLF